MKITVRHISIYLITAMVLIASTGVSLCCMFGCHDLAVLNGELECCEEKIQWQNGQQNDSCDGCQAEYVSLDTDYLLTSSIIKLNLPVQFTGILPFVSFSIGTIQRAAFSLKHNLPPPPYGKSLLLFIQVFRC